MKRTVRDHDSAGWLLDRFGVEDDSELARAQEDGGAEAQLPRHRISFREHRISLQWAGAAIALLAVAAGLGTTVALSSSGRPSRGHTPVSRRPPTALVAPSDLPTPCRWGPPRSRSPHRRQR